jgi:hypothetical protein
MTTLRLAGGPQRGLYHDGPAERCPSCRSTMNHLSRLMRFRILSFAHTSTPTYDLVLYFHVERTTVWLAPEDREAIAHIRRRFGLAHDADAMRLAFRVLAEAKELAIGPLPRNVEVLKTEG